MWNYTQLSVRILASQLIVCLFTCSTNAAQEASTNPAPKDQSSPIASPTIDDDGPKKDLKAEQATSVVELSEEEAAEVRAAERFLSILEKNPRRGTAFDRVYSHHIDFGTLEKLLATLRERTQKSPEDGIAWQLLGLFELHRGQHQAAVKQLVQAEKLRETDPFASYYLGLAQAADGEFAAAVRSLERAIERKPQRTDLLEIYQQLGRFHLRAQQIDEALATWKRLEELFPNDPRVLEEIAVALVQEEKFDLAKQHFVRLLPVLRDDFKRSSIQIQIAELTTQLGDKASGIAQLEDVLSSLKPDSWLFRDVRRRIDETFLKAKDQDGLVKYYENWLAGHGEDLDAMTRLARFLNSVGRSKEAMEWSEKAIKFAPNLVDLRKSHIQLLVESSLYERAIEQYRQLTQLEPANIDHLKQWGVLIMRQSNLPDDQRRLQALAVWQKIIEKVPEDAVTVSQVADLCLQHKLLEQAESYYRQAVKLAPDDVQYREYLGEFLHRQKRVDEALVVWSEITSGSRETSSNLARVAEIYNNFGFTEKANSAIARAAELSPKDFQLQVLAAKMHNRSGAQAKASQFITAAESIASDSEERDLVIAERIASLQGTKSLLSEASRLELQLQQATVAEDQKPNNAESRSQQYYRLARYWEACRQWNSARQAADKAIALEPRDLAPRILCGRIAELTKEYAEAAKIYRELASVDRRSRAAHWMKVSEIELLIGNLENAVDAAQQVVQSAPNVSANYEFYSNVCLKAGKVDEAILALRKAIRAQPKETVLLMSLAKSLADTKRTEEAIETYFRALEKSDDVEDMLEIVKRLTPLYQTGGSIDDLVGRLEADRKLPEMERKIAICLAQIWRSQGNLRKARQQLEELYTEESKDTILLNQLSKLCQEAGEIQSAINYQRKLVAIAPGAETELPLANLLYEAGKDDEAREITIKLLLQDPDPVHQLAGIDNLIKRRDWLTSSQILDSLVSRYPNDWEFLFRAAVTQYHSGNHDQSASLFRRVLALNLPLTTLGRREAERAKNERRKSTTSQTAATDSEALPSLMQLKAISNTLGFNTTPQQFNRNQMAQMAFGGQAVPSQSRFAPADFLQVRLASLVCLKSMHSDFQEYTEGLKGKPSEAPSRDLMRVYDRLFVAIMRGDHDEQLDVAKQAAALGGDSERMLLLEAIQQSVQPPVDDEEEFLMSSTIRGVPGLAVPSTGNSTNETPPPKLLSTADLQLAIETYLAIDPQALEQRSNAGLNSLLGSYSGGNRQILLSLANGGFAYATMNGPRLEGHTLPIFLLTQARFSSNMVAMAKLEEHILKNCISPSLVMHVLCKKIVQSESESIQPWLARWKELSEKSIRQQQTNSNLGFSPFANSGLGEAEVYRIITTANSRISPQSLRDLLSVLLPVYFQQSQTRHDLNLSSMTVNAVDRHPTLMPYRSELSLITQLVSSRQSVIESSALTQFLREQRDKSTTAEDRACWDICMAGLEYGYRRFPSCVEYMQRVVGAFPEDNAMKLALANVLELDGKYFEALQTIKQIVAKDLRLKNHLDLCMIRLAIRLGDRQLAMPLAEQLYAQQLQPDQADQLTNHLLSLGMQEQAQALIAKRQATSRTRSSTMQSFSQSAQGMGSGASQFGEKQALQHLATTSCEVGMDEIPMAFFTWRARADGRQEGYTTNQGTQLQIIAGAMAANTMPTASNRMRIQSLQYLANSGKLKALEEKVAEELKQSPESLSKWTLRLEYQLNLSNEDLNPTLRKLVELRPNSRAFRFMLARNQEKAEVTDEIFETYVRLLREHPAWTILALRNTASMIYSTDSQRQNYARALLEIDPALLRDSIDSVSLCKSLIRREDTRSLGLELFQHLSKGYKSQLIALQSQFLNDKSKSLWDIPEFFDLFVNAMLPEETRIRKDPWAMAFLLASNMTPETVVSGSGRKQVQQNMFERFLLELKYERVLSWKSSLQKHIDEHSQWQGGQLLMIQTESHLGLEKELVDRLSALIDKEVLTNVNDVYVIGWLSNLSQTSIKIPPNLEAKILLQIARNPIASATGMSNRLLQLCARSGPSSEVRTILSDLSQGSTQIVEVAETQIKLGYVLDALRLLLPIKPPNDIAIVDARTTNAPRRATVNDRTQTFSNDVRVSLDFNDALTKSRSAWPAAQVADQIFVATSQDSSAVCDLLVLLPKPADVFTAPISSPVFEQFVLAVEKSEGGDKLLQQIIQLVASKPDDLRLSKLDLLWQIHKEQATAAEIANRIQPLISGPNSNPDAITLDDALELWLVAANLIKSKKYREAPEVIPVATQLAQAALQKARENRLVNYEVSVLGQWASILASQGQTKAAEEKCREVLFALGRSNPDGQRVSGEATHRSIAYGIPQFLQAMALAAFAHKLGAEELRIETLKQALGEKLPIAEAEVSKELRDLVASQRGQPMSIEMFNILKLAVFPGNSMKLVRFHAIMRDRTNIEVENVALELVARAAELNQLDSLSEENQQRSEDRLNHLAMKVLIALKRNQDVEAKPAMEEMLSLISERKPMLSASLSATIAAKQALDRPELATIAKDILVKQGLRPSGH